MRVGLFAICVGLFWLSYADACTPASPVCDCARAPPLPLLLVVLVLMHPSQGPQRARSARLHRACTYACKVTSACMLKCRVRVSNLRRLVQLNKDHETLSSSNSDLERRFADASATNASNANLIHALKVEYERVRMRMRVCVYA